MFDGHACILTNTHGQEAWAREGGNTYIGYHCLKRERVKVFGVSEVIHNGKSNN